MATNRYGQIWHADSRIINIRFPSGEERDAFAKHFEEYHASHDHDGEVPRFENVNASEATKNYHLRNYGETTIDGYKAYEILEYHEKPYEEGWMYYHPPTCCVPSLISLGSRTLRGLRSADSLRRHDLSAIFANMPADDFKSLLESVDREGFIDNVIRIYENKVLDGWHRYRAAKELNLLRKLRFQVWDEREGDPKAFVYGRNLNRRHYSASQRAQVAVTFNERYGHGGSRSESKTTKGDLKTHKELAKEAGVSSRTIDRAVAVEKTGQSDAVIAGEKTASQVLAENRPNSEGCRKELHRTLSNQWYLNKSNVDIRALSETYHLSVEEVRKLKDKVWTDGLAAAKAKHKTARHCAAKEWLDWRELSDPTTWSAVCDAACRQFAFLSKDTFDGSREKLAYVDYAQLQREIDQLEKFEECLVQRAGWLQALIPEPTSEDDEPKPDALRSLWEQVTAEMKLWKQRDKEKCPNPGDAISHASKTMLINALRQCNHSEETGAATEDELKQLLQLMKSDNFGFTIRVRHVLKASQPQEVDQSGETPPENETSESEPHPATRNLLIPDDPNNVKVCLTFAYPQANGFSHQVLGKELFELPRDVALPDDATSRNEAFATAFAVLKLLLVPTEDSSESDEELTAEGVAGIDLHALNDTLSALLERLGVDEMHYSFKQSLTADLYDVFLQYENVPNAKEMLIALLDTAHSVLSELT